MQENPRKITRTKNNLTRTIRKEIPNFKGTSPYEITPHPKQQQKWPLKKKKNKKQIDKRNTAQQKTNELP